LLNIARYFYRLKQMIEKLINDTRHAVRETLKKFSKPACACSFGLDSMVTLFFVREVIPDIPVIFVNSGTEYPEIYDYIKEIVPAWKINLIKIPSKHSFLWVTRRHGFPLHSRGTPYGYDRKYLPAHYCCLYLKKRPLEQFIRRKKYDVVIDGMRSDESLMRRYTIRKYGVLHYHKGNRSFRYHAIAYWTRAQEEEAINILKIPISKLYNNTMPGVIARSGCWCCTMNWKYKRNQYLQKFYPKLWKILMNKMGFAKFMITRKTGAEPTDEQTQNYIDRQPCFFDTP